MEKEEKTTEEKITLTDRVVVYLICAMILCFGIAFLMTTKKDFSEVVRTES